MLIIIGCALLFILSSQSAVKHLRDHKGVGTLIVSECPSSSFWPFLHSSPSQFASFAKEILVLPRLLDLLTEGPGQRMTYRRKPFVFVGCPSSGVLSSIRRSMEFAGLTR